MAEPFEIPNELVDKPWAWEMYFKLKARDKEMGTNRRADILQMIPAELAIRNAVLEVEKLGADTRLTDIVVSLSEQQRKLADWCESTGNVKPD
jgi:hypothetical protein